MLKSTGFRSSLASLWFRLTTLAIIGLVFAEALFLGRNRIQGWTFYLTTSEVVFEVAVRLLFGALSGMALGSILTVLLAPFLYYFHSSRERLVEWATRIAVVLVLFPDSRYALTSLIQWSGRGVRFTSALLVAHFLFFVVALCIPRLRRELVTSLDGFLGKNMARSIALAAVTTTIALVGMEFALSKSKHTVKTATVSQPRPTSNIVLITFDALSAEDMSLYGYKLPTTPNIDAFARNATVFTNFYSGSTFTTPSVATILTGTYPSDSHVYQLQSRLRDEKAENNLPRLMRTSGYATGASFPNPYAYYLVADMKHGFDVLPEPTFQQGGLQRVWERTGLLHQDSGFGCRLDEYFELETLWNTLSGVPLELTFRYSPAANFAQAKQALALLPDGFFLWIHVFPPHNPYLPGPRDRGRFLAANQTRTFEENFGPRWKPYYKPDEQSQVDDRRLRYDEFIASADRAFGAFMSELESSGKLRNTTVIISADHGESFEGGIYQHETPYLTRPVIHVPLIIKRPNQQGGRKVSFTADQTALAPTILELAGVPKPNWMRGESLASRLSRDGQGEGMAFTQYLEKNSSFKPPQHGMVGVIDGQYQYVLDLDTRKGALRPLDQAQIWDVDQSSQHPERAESLRTALHEKFPDIVPAK